ncbi:reverse transcriptase domain-containing protein [Artemisia annua]|uniref:Reverse transcriptase domain-containing protein n=1 Tax=Artemisia annua TaxID=35608 RepID=A0A2U1MH97_ARTAN|nr:reverse transcriptase domain-containing protein [Artemisia annua]
MILRLKSFIKIYYVSKTGSSNGPDERSIPGNNVVIQADMPYSGLTNFGTAFLSKFECSQMQHPLAIIIRAAGPALGLELNIRKTELFWPSCDGRKLREGLFPNDIGRPSLGVKLLGGAVSRDAGFISGLVKKRASSAIDMMRLLPQLGDPQSELLLLRSCMGIAKLFFGLRTCQPVYVEEAALLFDKGLREAIEDMVVCGGPFFGDLQWRLASLPISFMYRNHESSLTFGHLRCTVVFACDIFLVKYSN